MVATRGRRTAGSEPRWTRRQEEVLELLSKGYTNPRIAEHLGISLDGAKWHVAEILDRLDVGSREEAADYWRERNGLRPRLARMAGAVSGTFSMRWLGWAAGALAMVALGVLSGLVFVTRGGDDSDIAAPEPTAGGGSPTPVSTQASAGGPTSTPPPFTPRPETIAGAPVRTWTINPPEVPAEQLVVILGRGCWQCDGPDASIERAVVFIDGQSPVVRLDELIAGESEVYIQSVWVSPDSVEQWLSLCQVGHCGPVGPVTTDAVSRLLRSTDGGATWRHQSDVSGAVAIVGRQGGTLIARRWTAGQPGETYETYPGGTAIEPPVEGVYLAGATNSGLTWAEGGGTAYFGDDGAVVFDAAWDPNRNWPPRLASPLGPSVILLSWSQGRDQSMTGIVVDGELRAVMAIDFGSVDVGAWLPDGRGVGTATLRAGDIPGSTATGVNAGRGLAVPVIVDVEAGTLTPLMLFGPLFNGTQIATEYVSNRNRVIGATAPVDPLYRVSAPGDCLYLRDRPALSAATLNCLADGSLVTVPGDGFVEADGQRWASVRSVAGEEGWASLGYLEQR